jgi:metallo-beta-lactamase family protein
LRLTFHGAAGTVTGSSHLVESGGRRILLDCGMFQGRREESEARNRDPGFDAGSIDSIVLSHAHIDHAGLIPLAVRNGFRGTIHCTSATRDLAAMLLADSARIQTSDSDFVNKRRARRGEPPVEPLYGPEDAVAAMGHFATAPYGRSVEILPGIRIRFLDAGHILGSAQIELACAEGGENRLLLFSGDLGRPTTPVLRDPDLSSRPDCLLLESTYGGRNHGTPQEAVAKLREVISATVSRGGKVIIPAFSVGRTQEILYYLRILLRTKGIPWVPVFVDSPLSFDATEVYRLHPECYDSETVELIHSGNSPFVFKGLQFIQTVSGSRALNSIAEPMIIISASGMCEHGRILHHLSHNIENPSSTILIVGFMAKNTLGRRLADRESVVRIFGEEFQRRADVQIINGFSAHADSDGLVAYAKAVAERAGRVFLVHGEPDQSLALKQRLGRESGIDARIASAGEAMDV